MASETGRETTAVDSTATAQTVPGPLPAARRSADRRSDRELSPLAHLVSTPQDVPLGQALRLLGMEHTQSFETWLQFLQHGIRVRSWLSLAFPSSELNDCRNVGTPDDPVLELTATGFGLFGTLGPLPTFYTEELLDEARSDESVSRDFLDLINNRMHHCLYRASLWGKLARRTTELRNPQAGQVLHCLMGRAYPSLRPEGLPQTAVLNLLLRHTRSAMGLEDYCAYMLGFAGSERSVRVEQCVPRMARIPADQRCRLGQANSTLGTDMTLGEQVRDCTGKFRLHLECLSRTDMKRFLPTGTDFNAIDTHVRQYMDVPLEYDLVLHPAPDTGFRQRLGERLGGYLIPADTPPAQSVTVYHSA